MPKVAKVITVLSPHHRIDRSRVLGHGILSDCTRGTQSNSSALLDIHIPANDGPPPLSRRSQPRFEDARDFDRLDELSNSKYGINHLLGHDFHAGACNVVAATPG
jgi:hypothetical protein